MKELVKKLAKIQSTLKAPKNQFNKFGNYNFRNKEDILEALKPFLKDLDVAITLNDEVVNIGKFNYIKSTATITDGENSISATSFAREAEEQKGMNPAQMTGSSNSYAGKYALGDLLLLDDTKDDDATNTHGKTEAIDSNAQKALNLQQAGLALANAVTAAGPIKSFKRPTKTTTVSSGDDL